MGRLFSERLVLRPIERADLGTLSGWYADPVIMRYVGDGHTYSPIETEIALHCYLEGAARDGHGLMIAELAATGEPIGRCGFKAWDVDGERLLEIGWLVARPHQGNGYATEAGAVLRDHGFEELGNTTLISVIQPENRPSIRVAEKLGGRYWREWITPGGSEVALYRYERP